MTDHYVAGLDLVSRLGVVMYRSGLFLWCNLCWYRAKKRTVCSLRSNVCARFLGLRVCILTELASVRLCVHACVCNGGARLVVNSVYPLLG